MSGIRVQLHQKRQDIVLASEDGVVCLRLTYCLAALISQSHQFHILTSFLYVVLLCLYFLLSLACVITFRRDMQMGEFSATLSCE